MQRVVIGYSCNNERVLFLGRNERKKKGLFEHSDRIASSSWEVRYNSIWKKVDRAGFILIKREPHLFVVNCIVNELHDEKETFFSVFLACCITIKPSVNGSERRQSPFFSICI